MNENNVYNVDESQVQDLAEYVEPIEQVEATVVDNKKTPDTIAMKGIIFASLAFMMGIFSCGGLFLGDFSYLLCIIESVLSFVFGVLYLTCRQHNRFFGKLALIGFILGVFGIFFGGVRFLLGSVAALGKAFFHLMF